MEIKGILCRFVISIGDIFMAKTDFSKGPVWKCILTQALPLTIAQLAQLLYNIIDRIYLGHMEGADSIALTGVGLTFPIVTLIAAFTALFGNGGVPLFSMARGAGNEARANKIMGNAFALLLCAAGALTALCYLFAEPILFAFGASEESYQYANAYLRIYLAGTAFSMLSTGMNGYINAQGFPKIGMLTTVIGAVINIVLDPILIFGLFGLPRMEVAGAALATVIGQIVAATMGAVLNVKYNPDIHISLRRIRWHGQTAREIYRVGIPSIIMQSIGSIMTFSLNRILISFTEAATAVFGAYFKLQSFIFMPVFGLNNGMVPIVSYNFGAAREDRVKKAIRLTICTAICIMTVGAILFETIPGVLLGFFNPSGEMLAIGQTALRIIAPHLPLAGFCIIAGSVCQAIGNPVHSLITSVCRQIVVLIPAAWLLAQTGNLTLVWFAFPIAELMSLLLSTIFLRKTMHAASARMRELSE